MHRWTILTIALTLASAIGLASTVIGEDVDECEGDASLEVCVHDTTEGDREDCQGVGSGEYRGASGASASAGAAFGGVDAETGGEHVCSGPDGDERERLFLATDLCLEGEEACDEELGSAFEWTPDEVQTTVTASGEAGDLTARATWRSSDVGPCALETEVRVSSVVFFWHSGTHPCVVPPGDPPNPGWGELTPDVPE